MQAEQSHWQVVLIGGSSGVGKTIASQELAKVLSLSHMLVDDIRIAIQAVTSPAHVPALHYFLTQENLAALPAEAFIDGLVDVGRTLAPAVCAIIQHHLAVPTTGRLILEGDGILPELVEHLNHIDGASTVAGGRTAHIRMVFLAEPDEAHLLHNFIERDRGFRAVTAAEQRAYVHTIWRFGVWITAEAARYGIPVLTARPYATLAQRILEAVE